MQEMKHGGGGRYFSGNNKKKNQNQPTNEQKHKTEDFGRHKTEEPTQSLKKERFKRQCSQDAGRYSNQNLPLFIFVFTDWTVS